MSISDIDVSRRKNARAAITYLAFTAFCGFFSSVYFKFSHGVSSDYLVFLCAVPFVGGVLPYTALYLLKLYPPYSLFAQMYNCGIATLTVGCCLSGVFDVYGSRCGYVPIYFYAGAILTVLGLILCAVCLIKRFFKK